MFKILTISIIILSTGLLSHAQTPNPYSQKPGIQIDVRNGVRSFTTHVELEYESSARDNSWIHFSSPHLVYAGNRFTISARSSEVAKLALARSICIFYSMKPNKKELLNHSGQAAVAVNAHVLLRLNYQGELEGQIIPRSAVDDITNITCQKP